MTVCQTCGGFGMRHDPIAHDAEAQSTDDADVISPADCGYCCPSGWSSNIDQFPHEDCPIHGREAL